MPAVAASSVTSMDILSFSGEHRWLSNFWPCAVELDGLEFSSVEAAYVAAKTTDRELRLAIQQLPTAGRCKKFGRSLPLRADWDEIKLDVMLALLRQKFRPSSPLAEMLLATGSCNIVEGNQWGDRFWGVCDGQGHNFLGKLIMHVRAELASGVISDFQRGEKVERNQLSLFL